MTALDEAKWITPCCGYDCTREVNPIVFNPYNKVVQCHNCGQVYEAAKPSEHPSPDLKVLEEVREALEFYAEQNNVTDDVLQTNVKEWNQYCEESEPPFYIEMGYKAEKALAKLDELMKGHPQDFGRFQGNDDN